MKYSCCGLPTKKGLAWESCGMAALGPRTAPPPCWSLGPELTLVQGLWMPLLPDSGPVHRTGPLSGVPKLRKAQKAGMILHSAPVISEACQVMGQREGGSSYFPQEIFPPSSQATPETRAMETAQDLTHGLLELD